MTTSTAERQERRHADRQVLILQAAAEEFASNGYERATLEQIGDRVGLSKGSLYYYVKSKEQLLELLLKSVVEQILTQVDPSADPQVRLSQLVRAHVEATLTSQGRVLVQNLDAIVGSTTTAEVRHQYAASISTILIDGAATGAFRNLPDRATVRFLLGALNAACRWNEPTTAQEIDDLVDLLIILVLEGIGSRS